MKRFVRDLLRKAGWDVRRYQLGKLGRDPWQDLRHLLRGVRRPLIFDVGANIGQSVDAFRKSFPDSFVHSFEPSPGTYARLIEHCKGMNGVRTWNCGVGSSPTNLPFLENSHSFMSSFLAPGEGCWGRIEKTTDVEVVTLDSFAGEQGIAFIHVLKSDTQGYDFEVFRGAEHLMNEGRIGLIYFEFIFSKMYQNLPTFHEVFRFLSDHNFSLVSFYEPHFQQDLLSWTDVLFVNNEFNHQRLKPGGTTNP